MMFDSSAVISRDRSGIGIVVATGLRLLFRGGSTGVACPGRGSGGGDVNGHGPDAIRVAFGGGCSGGGSGSAILVMAGRSRFPIGIIVTFG